MSLRDRNTLNLYSDPPIEFSISVPNLSELGLSPSKPVVERSVSENEAERQNYRKLQLKMERRIKNREKLMAMKRYSGFLKRPEILGIYIAGNVVPVRT